MTLAHSIVSAHIAHTTHKLVHTRTTYADAVQALYMRTAKKILGFRVVWEEMTKLKIIDCKYEDFVISLARFYKEMGVA
jgi:hypothetical protein